MLRHVIFDLPLRMPIDRSLKVFLSNWNALEIVAAEPVCRATCLTEIPLRIGSPWACVDSVAHFLIGEFLARDVNGPEPLQSFAGATRAKIDHQLVTKNPFLLVVLEIVKG